MNQSSDAVLDLAAIQGVVLRGIPMPVGTYVFLTVTDPFAGRSWVGAAIERVTSAAPWDAKPTATISIGFSAHGLRALGVPEDSMNTFPSVFLAGMATRAHILGDTAASAPEHWDGGLGTAAIHAVVMISASTPEVLAECVAWLKGTLSAGVVQAYRQDVSALPDGTEHFGYADGFSQPDVAGLETGSRHGQGVYEGGDRWRPIRPGEFILGYPDEEGVLPPAPEPEALGRNGSYLVVRKLTEDVVGFRDQLSAHAALTGLPEEVLAAKLVGRWRDGTPLAVSPQGPDPQVMADLERTNTFDYADDPRGDRCPVGAHIRRMNPRLSMPFDGKMVNRHRLVRRGLPFGPPLPRGAPDDGADRGVMFACFQADLERQFEFIQSQWANDGNAFGLGTDKDPLLGDHQDPDKFTINGGPPAFAAPLRRLVSVRGGEYFFVPGLNGLAHLSNMEA